MRLIERVKTRKGQRKMLHDIKLSSFIFSGLWYLAKFHRVCGRLL